MKNLESIYELTGCKKGETSKNIKSEVYTNCYIPKGTILLVDYKAKSKKENNPLYVYFDYDIEFEKIMNNNEFTRKGTVDNFSLINKKDIETTVGFLNKASMYSEKYVVEITDLCQVTDRINSKYYENDLDYPSIGKFSENHVFDENKSVVWNREEVERQNNLIQDEKDAYKNRTNELQEEFENNCINAICSDYTKINKEQATLLFNYAYRKSHSGGYLDVVYTLEELEDLATNFIKAGNKEEA